MGVGDGGTSVGDGGTSVGDAGIGVERGSGVGVVVTVGRGAVCCEAGGDGAAPSPVLLATPGTVGVAPACPVLSAALVAGGMVACAVGRDGLTGAAPARLGTTTVEFGISIAVAVASSLRGVGIGVCVTGICVADGTAGVAVVGTGAVVGVAAGMIAAGVAMARVGVDVTLVGTDVVRAVTFLGDAISEAGANPAIAGGAP